MQIIRTTEPLNSEPPAEELARELVTPTPAFYVRNHGNVPEIDTSAFRLSVEGMVAKPLLLSLDQLRKQFEKVTVMAALQCAGNRRSEMAAVRPIQGEVPWGSQAIGNAVWAGARLRDVLQAAGVREGARHVAFIGADAIEKEGKRIGFGASVALEKAMSPDTLLAYEMNGLPLEPVHGFPLRGVVPGFIGARSVKWLATVTLQREPSDNFYQSRSYKVFPPDVTAQSVDWSKEPALEPVVVNSVICHPTTGAPLLPGSVRLSGYAIGEGGAPIERVEVSIDGGATWQPADLLGKAEPWRWNLWEARVELDTGSYELVVRARDAAGHAQPVNGDDLWNFKGYAWNAWHRLRVTVAK